jgi:hypothetical protein
VRPDGKPSPTSRSNGRSTRSRANSIEVAVEK